MYILFGLVCRRSAWLALSGDRSYLTAYGVLCCSTRAAGLLEPKRCKVFYRLVVNPPPPLRHENLSHRQARPRLLNYACEIRGGALAPNFYAAAPGKVSDLKGPLSQPSGFTFQASGAFYGLVGRCYESSDPLLLYRRMGQAFCRQYLVLSLKLAMVASALVVS